MGAKDLVLRPIPNAEARDFIRAHHYSGKVANNSQISIGAFLAGRLEGALMFGPPTDRSKLIGLVRGSERDSFLELNRMAFSDRLPRNSESRALGVTLRILRHHMPRLRWIVSFADACQCGDGTIYRAAGFFLTQIKQNSRIVSHPRWGTTHVLSLEPASNTDLRARLVAATGAPRDISGGTLARLAGFAPVPGYMFRYVAFVDPTWVDRLTVPVIPYSQIPPECRMYKGTRQLRETSGDHPEGGRSDSDPGAPPPVDHA